MKRIIILTAATLIVVFFWVLYKTENKFDRGKYITQDVLDTSVPIDVKIDLELINDLVPAYER